MQFFPVSVGFLLLKVIDIPRAATAAVTLASLCPWWVFTPHVKGNLKYNLCHCRASIYKRKGGCYFPCSFLQSCNYRQYLSVSSIGYHQECPWINISIWNISVNVVAHLRKFLVSMLTMQAPRSCESVCKFLSCASLTQLCIFTYL